MSLSVALRGGILTLTQFPAAATFNVLLPPAFGTQGRALRILDVIWPTTAADPVTVSTATMKSTHPLGV